MRTRPEGVREVVNGRISVRDVESGRAKDLATRIALAVRAVLGTSDGRDPQVIAIGDDTEGILIVGGVALGYFISGSWKDEKSGKWYYPLEISGEGGGGSIRIDVPAEWLPEIQAMREESEESGDE